MDKIHFYVGITMTYNLLPDTFIDEDDWYKFLTYQIFFIDADIDNIDDLDTPDLSQIPSNFLFNAYDRSIKFTPSVPSKEHPSFLYKWILSYQNPYRFVLVVIDPAGKSD